jgi:hypothetical protein
MALVASFAVAACVGSAGSAPAAELSESGINPEVSGQEWVRYRFAGVHLHVGHGLQFGAATNIVNERTDTFSELENEGRKGAGYKYTFYQIPFRSRVNPPDTGASWQILDGGGSPTGFTLVGRVGWKGDSCTIEGSGGPNEGHFHCSVTKRGADLDWDIYVKDDRVDRRAEASGSITTDGSVSLDASPFLPAKAYTTESKLRVNGADVVPANSSTQFDAVLTRADVEPGPGKNPTEPDTARMKFRYAIRDANQPGRSIPQFYVRGDVSNHRGGKFTGGSSCEIVDYLDTPVQNSGYTCTANGYHASTGIRDGRVHYITDFTISKKQ